MSDENTASELSEDMEVIGPGQMLAEARIKMGLSQEQVAEKLNFRPLLVRDIEAEIFDKGLPTTFNRGYLRNYAKLVNISVEQVLASYEMLGVAETQGAELQSFSKITEKQAETNLVVWIGYLVIALLIGSTVMWWLQDVKEDTAIVLPDTKQDNTLVADITEQSTSAGNKTNVDNQAGVELSSPVAEDKDTALSAGEKTAPAQMNQALARVNEQAATESVETQSLTADADQVNTLKAKTSKPIEQAEDDTQGLVTQVQQEVNSLSTAVFTFTGDCYVNIFDATGERIAYGLKKSGYVMTISGVAPLNITIGRPDLVAINFDGQEVDMSNYPGNNIAKFNLPMSPPDA